VEADDPVALFERATTHAAKLMSGVFPSQLNDVTPCADWNVQQLIDHMVGGTDYLQAALTGQPPQPGLTVRSRTIHGLEDGPPQERLLAAMGRRP
jgi:hypothetical protein